MNLNKTKKYFFSFVLSLFLLAGLYINYELDKDFLSQFGFTGFFVIVSISFFIGLKIISEFLFFRLKGIAKWLVGSFALFVVLGSILSIFFVRIYKSESMFQHTNQMNKAIDEKEKEQSQNRTILTSQIQSIEKQISSKLALIQSLTEEKDKWLKLRYNKEVNDLNTQKTALINDLRTAKTNQIVVEKKETSLHDSLNRVFGFDSTGLTLAVNLLFTLFVDSSLILLAFGLSYVNSQKEGEKSNPDPILKPQVNPNDWVVNFSKGEEKVNPIQYDPKEDKMNGDFLKKLNQAIEKSNLSKEEFANQVLGISKVALWKIENGTTKKIREDLREKVMGL